MKFTEFQKIGEFSYFDFSAPTHADLYLARKNAAMTVKTDFLVS